MYQFKRQTEINKTSFWYQMNPDAWAKNLFSLQLHVKLNNSSEWYVSTHDFITEKIYSIVSSVTNNFETAR